MRDALERLSANEDIRVLVYTAQPEKSGSFSSGFTAEAAQTSLAHSPDRQPPQLLAGLRVPSIAALFGRVADAALELALACDVRVAAEDARLELPQLAAGSLPSWGGTQRLARLAGIGRALEMVLLGGSVSAQDALNTGLVTRLVRRGELDAEVKRIVGGWLAGPPVALAYAKEAVRQGGDLPLDHALRLEWDLAVLLETTHDRSEGIRAFLEKREPRFSGQ